MVNSRKISFGKESGVTLVELLVVVLIISIVVALALIQTGTANQQLKRQNIVVELKTAFERARFNSVKRRADSPSAWATVTVNDGSFVLNTYEDQGGTPTAIPVTTDFTAQSIVVAGYESQSVPYTIYFNRHGEPVDSSGNSVSPVFLVCNVSCNARSDSTANLVLVTPTGTVNLLSGSSTPPSFNAPSINNIPTSTGVNPTVSVP